MRLSRRERLFIFAVFRKRLIECGDSSCCSVASCFDKRMEKAFYAPVSLLGKSGKAWKHSFCDTIWRHLKRDRSVTNFCRNRGSAGSAGSANLRPFSKVRRSSIYEQRCPTSYPPKKIRIIWERVIYKVRFIFHKLLPIFRRYKIRCIF